MDPTFHIRKVDYIADHNGFHPIINGGSSSHPDDTPVVAAAKEKHLAQYTRIAEQHQFAPQAVVVPKDSRAVQNAKNRHLSLYQKIAEEHARIAAEREAQKLAEENEHPNFLDHAE